jgi:hypothetical protein
LATTAAVCALSFSAAGARRAFKADVDPNADIIVHLAKLSLTQLKTNAGRKNRHHLAKNLKSLNDLESAGVAN